MTETEARKRYKAEWAKRNRDKIKASYQRFYERKAAEYAAADAAAGRMTAAEKAEEKVSALKMAIWALEDKIAHPEIAVTEWRKEKKRLETEYKKALQDLGKGEIIDDLPPFESMKELLENMAAT